jgi:AraC-like DNA-binding protein
MQQAVQLLQAGGSTIGEVARTVGYDSRSSFVHAFRAVHKQDPSDLR